jgi:hypothetical protein
MSSTTKSPLDEEEIAIVMDDFSKFRDEYQKLYFSEPRLAEMARWVVSASNAFLKIETAQLIDSGHVTVQEAIDSIFFMTFMLSRFRDEMEAQNNG